MYIIKNNFNNINQLLINILSINAFNNCKNKFFMIKLEAFRKSICER